MAQLQLRASPQTVRIGVFDASYPPIMTIESGDTVEVQCVSGRQEVMPPPSAGLKSPPELDAIIAANPAMRAGHIVTGPIAIAGAEPGDMLEIRIEKIEPGADWGYNVIRPLAGTLPEDFHETVISHIPVDRARGVCTLPWGTELKLAPFFGVMGVAPPPAFGTIASKEPRIHGGNMDNKELVAGSHTVSTGVGAGRELLGGRWSRRAGRRRGLRHRVGNVPDRHVHVRVAQGRRVFTPTAEAAEGRDADALHQHGPE